MPTSSNAPTRLCVSARPIWVVSRDIGSSTAGSKALEEVVARELSLARRVCDQDHRQRAPEIEIGRLRQASIVP